MAYISILNNITLHANEKSAEIFNTRSLSITARQIRTIRI
jgi:hypothetical protein